MKPYPACKTVNSHLVYFQAPENTITYFIQDSFGQSNYFLINPNNGQLSLLQSVLNTNVDFYRLQVTAQDGGTPMRFATIFVDVNVIRETDTLRFTLPEYAVTISETRPVSDVIIQTLANPGSPTYTILSGEPGITYFEMNPTTGQISVRRDLRTDPAYIQFHRLRIQATGQGAISTQIAQAYVNITVIRNANPPIFTQNSYQDVMPDTTAIGTSLVDIQANDADGDSVYYTVISGLDAMDYFYLNPLTGLITLRTYMYEVGLDQYRFTVQATDQRINERTATAEVLISILRDQSAPVFTNEPYGGSIVENSANGTTIAQTTCFDADLRGSIVFEAVTYTVSTAFFSINPSTGSIFVFDSAAIRIHPSTQYVFRVQCYDSAYPNIRDTSDVVITVSRNLNAPIFEFPRYTQTVPDTYPLGQEVLRVSATDSDGDAITYAITGDAFGNTNRAQEYYYIGADTGIIYLKKPLTEGVHFEDNINLRACDNRVQQQCGNSVAVITITRDQFTPFFINTPYQTTIERTRIVNSTVQQTTARDQDLKGEIRYLADGNYPAPTFFDLDYVTGTITLKQSVVLDGSLNTVYYMKLLAFDTFYPNNYGTATATIFVNRNPNAPIFSIPNYRVTIAETSPLGMMIVDTNATDADLDVLRYTMVNADAEDFAYFYLNPETGVISLRQSLLQTPTNQYQFSVEASDQSNPVRTATAGVIVDIVRDEQPPVFISEPYSTSIIETRTIGSQVYQVTAIDSDLRGSIVYNVVGDFRSPYYFDIDSVDGTISVKSDLRLESSSITSYNLIVTAYDSLSPLKVATATVLITVIRNPSTPVFALTAYQTIIPEFTSLGTQIFNISATDPDGDIVRYSFIPQNDQFNQNINKGLDYFYILETSGLVYLKQPLTNDVTDDLRYTMTVQARDQRIPNERFATAPVTVLVTRTRNPPIFVQTPYGKAVSENDPVGLSIYKVTATDSDLQERIMYDVIGDDVAPYYFRVNSTSGEVHIRNNLRTDVNFDYTLRVRAYDTAYPDQIATATVAITVSRNEYSPEFTQSPYRVTINETLALGTCILTVSASDQDGDRVTYSANGESNTLEYFSLSVDSGAICIRRPLQGPSTLEYRMAIVANDNSVPAKNGFVEAFITVIRDQFPPNFINQPYRRTLDERTSIGSSVYSVSAVDSDLVGQIRYELIGDYPTQSFFTLDSVTGLISTTANLRSDASYNTFYVARVIAYDSLRTTLKATATVEISIIRNPNTPVFTLPNYSNQISENTVPGTVVLNVTAVDADVTDIISYYITSQSGDNFVGQQFNFYYYIDQSSGLVWLRRSLLGTSINTFFFTFRACDNGLPQRCANSTGTITVTRNQFPPVFFNEPYSRVIQESTPLGSSIIQLTAQDNDRAGDMIYEATTTSYPFEVDRLTGLVTLQYDNLFLGPSFYSVSTSKMST